MTLKQGLLTGDGVDVSGAVCFADLGYPPPADTATARLLNAASFRIAPHPPSGHKGTRGNVLLLGGTEGMEGAGVLAGLAALRGGAGKLFWAGGGANLERPPEFICLEAAAVPDALADMDVVVAGCGLGDTHDELLAELWQSEKPLVLDADGLRWLARTDASPRTAPLIATPHPGEAKGLLDAPDRFTALKELQARFGGIWVLKGAGTLISGAPPHLCPLADGALGTAGMGDVLAGLIGGLWAQMPDETPENAALAGVFTHAETARRRLAANGGRGILASDLLGEIAALTGTLSR